MTRTPAAASGRQWAHPRPAPAEANGNPQRLRHRLRLPARHTASSAVVADSDRAGSRHPGAGSRWAIRRPRAAAPAPSPLLGGQCRQLVGLVLVSQWLDYGIQIAVHHLVKLVQREIDAVVSEPALRKVVGAYPVRAIAGADQVAALLRLLRACGILCGAVQPGVQQRHGARPVLVLGTLVLALDHDSRWNMRDAHRGVGLVDVLS